MDISLRRTCGAFVPAWTLFAVLGVTRAGAAPVPTPSPEHGTYDRLS
jgi:hypothetical protein